MKILVLGSAAGGGFPQWNCHCPNCKGVRDNTIKATPRTQSSIAVSVNDEDWVLINASPDLRQQINQSPQLWPKQQTRGTNIRGVVLCDSQVDHTTGLLTLREGLPMDLYATSIVAQDLNDSFPLIPMLKHWHGGLAFKEIGWDNTVPFSVHGVDGIEFYPVVLESNAPPYSIYRDAVVDGNNIGLKIVDKTTGNMAFYAPGIVETTPLVEKMLAQADVALIDGTLWLDDEMITAGVGKKLGSEMGHMPVNGPYGSVALLNKFDLKRRILIHINNTNPILNEESGEHQYVTEQGVELAFDGMEINV